MKYHPHYRFVRRIKKIGREHSEHSRRVLFLLLLECYLFTFPSHISGPISVHFLCRINSSHLCVLNFPGDSACPQQWQQEHAQPAPSTGCSPACGLQLRLGQLEAPSADRGKGSRVCCWEQLRRQTLAQLLPPPAPHFGMLSPSNMPCDGVHTCAHRYVCTNTLAHNDSMGIMKMYFVHHPPPATFYDMKTKGHVGREYFQ